MRLSPDLVAKFQKRYLDTFGEGISTEVAEAELWGLAELVRIAHPHNDKEIDDE